MVAYLSKFDANEGFNQIIDFLNGSSIKYALTFNPNIYVSCIKQFWTTVAVKKVNDVMGLQSLVDKKKVVITEASIRDALRLDDAKGVDCLPNEEIFTELARMGYEKPSTKLTFYKAFFSSHLVRNVDSPTKFYMYPHFLQLMIRKQVGDHSTHTIKYTSPALTQKVFANMRWVGKGFYGVDTPLFEGMTVEQEVVEEGDADENVENVNASDAAEGDQVETSDDTVIDDVSNHERMIAEIDQDADVVLEEAKEVADDAKDGEDVKVDESVDIQGRQAKSQAEIYKIDLDHANKVLVPAATLTAAPSRVTDAPSRRRKGVVIRDPQEESTTSTIIPAETKSKDKGKGNLVEKPKPLKKQTQIEQDEKYARELEAELNKNIDWDEVIDHVKKKAKEDPVVKRYQVLKRKPQTNAQARKNMMIYLKNVAGFKMDYFKGMSYDDIRPIFEAKFNTNVDFLQKTKEQIKEKESKALKRLNETPAEKAVKRQKLDEEVEELKIHLQIVPNEDDDVYTEATPLARKVPIVGYEIINQNNKPYYKIIRADARYTCSNLEKSKKCLWSSKSQGLEAVGILWFADHYIYNHTADFVSREEVPTYKVHSRSDAKCCKT
nr:hypothetical protein [Tanacetum cinerariifolium]